MTHNDFDFYEDLIRPLMQFLVQSNILTQANFESDEEDVADEGEFSSPDKSGNKISLKAEQQAAEKALFIKVSLLKIFKVSITESVGVKGRA